MAYLQSGTIIYGTANVNTVLNVLGTNTATNTTSGALVVSGGAGVAGNIYIGGNLVANGSNSIVIANSITTSGAASGIVNVAATLGNLGFRSVAATYTDTAVTGTQANAAIHYIATPTITGGTNAKTYTNLATFYIASNPTAGTNATVTNSYALFVASGNAYFASNVTVGNIIGNGQALTGLNASNISSGTIPNAVSNNISNVGTITAGTWNTAIGSSATFVAGLSGANLASLNGANVSGNVASSNVANVANFTVQTAQTTGTYYLSLANTNTSTNVSLNANTNINVALATGTLNATLFAGSGANLTTLNASNISSGTLSNAITNAISNLGTVSSGSIAGSLITGNVANANVANVANYHVQTAQTTGTYYLSLANTNTSTNVSLNANTNINVSIATGALNATLLGGTLTTAAQPNITSVSTSFTNLTFANAQTISGNNLTLTTGSTSNTGTLTGNWTISSGSLLRSSDGNASNVLYGNGAFAAVIATSATNASAVLTNTQTTGTYYLTGVSTAANANYSLNISSNVNVNFATNTVSATLFTGTLTTAAQPNITSVGTLSSLGVSGAVTASTLVSNVATGTAPLTVTSTTTVANLAAATATTAGTVTTAAQPNITSLGTLNNITVGAANSITGGNLLSATYLTGTLTTAAQPNITSVGTLTGVTIGNATNNVVIGNGTILLNSGLITGNGNGLSSLQASNITGTLPNAVTNNISNLGTVSSGSIAGSLITGNVANATLSNVANFTVQTAQITGTYYLALSNVATSGNVSLNANTNINVALATGALNATLLGGTLTTAAQPNITSVSTSFANLTFAANGNIAMSGAASQIAGGNLVSATYLTGTLTTAAQPNITSVGTLTGLSVSGTANITGGALYSNNLLLQGDGTSGYIRPTNSGSNLYIGANNNNYITITAAGAVNSVGNITAPQFTSNIATGTAPFVVTSTTQVANLNVATAGTATSATTAANATNVSTTLTSTGTAYIPFISATATANYPLQSNANFSANLANGYITATGFVGNFAGGVSTIAAAGTVQSNATVITTSIARVTSGTGGVVLPTVPIGVSMQVFNDTSANINVYPPSGSQIDNAAVNTAVLITSNSQAIYTYTSSALYETVRPVLVGNTNQITTTPGNGIVTIALASAVQVTSSITTPQFISNVSTGTAPFVVTSTTQVANLSVATAGTATSATTASNATNVSTTLTSTGTAYIPFISATATGNYPLESNANFSANLANGYITATGFVGNGSALTGITVSTIANGTSNVNIPASGGNVNISANGTANILQVTSPGGAASVIVTNLNSPGTVTAANITANTGYVVGSAANVTATGTVFANSATTSTQIIIANNVPTGTGLSLPSGTPGQRITVFNTSANSLLVYPSANGTINGGSQNAAVSVTSGVMLDFICTLNSSPVSPGGTWYTPAAIGIANGTSNINIPAANGNVNISAVGNANIVVVTGTGANIAGTANVTGNLTVGTGTGGNISGANLVSANYFTGTLINGNSNINIVANANVNISATGTANVLIITSTGANITGTANITGNANVGNIGAAIGVFTTAANTGLIQNGTSNVTIASGANVSVFTAGNATAQFVVTSSGANIPGTANVVGNANVGNIGAAQAIITTSANIPIVQNGNSNVSIVANANINFGVTGTANVVSITAAGIITTAANAAISSNSFTATGAAFGNVNTAAALSNLGFRSVAATYTDTAVTGTQANAAIHYIAQPTIGGGTNAKTYTNIATLFIANAPAATTNATITNSYAMFVGAGNSFFGGSANITGNANVGNIGAAQGIFTTSANIPIVQNGNSNVSIVANANINFGVTGTANVVSITAAGIITTAANAAISSNSFTATGAAFGNVNVAATLSNLGFRSVAATYTDTAATGTQANAGIHYLAIPTITGGTNAKTYTNFATLYIAGNATAGTNATITNNYAMFVASGNSLFNGTVSATVFNATSDRRLKKNIVTIDYPLDIVSNLSGVRYQWINNDEPSAGLIAQDVEVVMPELVSDIGDGMKTINYNGIIGALVESVKQLNSELTALRAEVTKLRKV